MGIFRRLRILESDESELSTRVGKLNDALCRKTDWADFVECDKCGCLLYKDKAFKGKGEIRTKRVMYFLHSIDEEHIHYPYYCKIHKKTQPERKVK